MNLNNRIEKLENRLSPEGLPELEITYVESRDQVHNTDKYDKVLECEETAESGIVTRYFQLEPKPGYNPPADPMKINKD